MPIQNIPYPYTLDTDPAHRWPWHMDAIHIQQLYRMCERIRPRTVVEVGSYMGCSTSAFVEAMRDGFVEKFACHELRITDELMAVIDHAPPGVDIRPVPYPTAPIYADLILIDGDHEHGAVADTLAALCMGCPHIVMHDSNSHTLGIGCHGVFKAVKLLLANKDYRCSEDYIKRPGMFTERGMFYACKVGHTYAWHSGDLP